MSCEGDKWVDISASQLAAIQNETIEKCAATLDLEATHNDKVANDERDFLGTRFNAYQNAGIKRYCAALLRTTKS